MNTVSCGATFAASSGASTTVPLTPPLEAGAAVTVAGGECVTLVPPNARASLMLACTERAAAPNKAAAQAKHGLNLPATG